MYYTDDPIVDSYRYEDEQEQELSKLPVCSECGEHIQDDVAYYINNEWICPHCMGNFLRIVEAE